MDKNIIYIKKLERELAEKEVRINKLEDDIKVIKQFLTVTHSLTPDQLNVTEATNTIDMNPSKPTKQSSVLNYEPVITRSKTKALLTKEVSTIQQTDITTVKHKCIKPKTKKAQLHKLAAKTQKTSRAANDEKSETSPITTPLKPTTTSNLGNSLNISNSPIVDINQNENSLKAINSHRNSSHSNISIPNQDETLEAEKESNPSLIHGQQAVLVIGDYHVKDLTGQNLSVTCIPDLDLNEAPRYITQKWKETKGKIPIIVQVGSKDIGNKCYTETIIKKYERILADAKNDGINIHVTGIFPQRNHSNTFLSKTIYINNSLELMCEKMKISYHDHWEALYKEDLYDIKFNKYQPNKKQALIKTTIFRSICEQVWHQKIWNSHAEDERAAATSETNDLHAETAYYTVVGDNIAETLRKLGMIVIDTPGDGHCMLHSIKGSWERQLQEDAPSLDILKDIIIKESENNIEVYKDICSEYISHPDKKPEKNSRENISPEEHFRNMRADYIDNKQFDNKFGDCVIPIIVNGAHVIINIIEEEEELKEKYNIPKVRKTTKVIKKRIAPEGVIRVNRSLNEIYIHKKGDHYSIMGMTDKTRPNPQNEKTSQEIAL